MSKRHPYFAPLLLVALWLSGLLIARSSHGASGQSGYPPGANSIVAQGYYPDQQEKQPWRGPLAVADPTALTAINLATFTVANGGRIRTLGRPNVPVSLRFTNANQSACISYAPIWVNPGAPTVDHLLGIAPLVTLTATAFTDPDGRFIATTWLFDSYGGSDGIVLLVSPPSAGSVYMDPGTY